METLNRVGTTGVEPLTHATYLSNAFREDAVKPSLPHNLSMANAPEERANSFRVPKVIES
jgi:aspartyl-tRNA(Asn)/glutamyl-tRNA(Gln) amidotransferase subunit C